MSFARDGAECFPGAVTVHLRAIEAAIAGLPPDRAGIRLRGIAALRPLLAPEGPVGSIAATAIGLGCRPVRAVLFDKTPANNWALAWHQDRTIAVVRRRDADGFGPWTVKDGMAHVAPPYELLAGMATLRVHLDPVPAGNAPLLVAPGSHRRGRIAEADIPGIVRERGIRACLAEAGDVWLYATPILHASEAAREPGRRRVLQVDYTTADLPGGLEWLGV